MGRSNKTYRVVITPSSNPDAASFDELMSTEIKGWIEGILEHAVRSGAIRVDPPGDADE